MRFSRDKMVCTNRISIRRLLAKCEQTFMHRSGVSELLWITMHRSYSNQITSTMLFNRIVWVGWSSHHNGLAIYGTNTDFRKAPGIQVFNLFPFNPSNLLREDTCFSDLEQSNGLRYLAYCLWNAESTPSEVQKKSSFPRFRELELKVNRFSWILTEV